MLQFLNNRWVAKGVAEVLRTQRLPAGFARALHCPNPGQAGVQHGSWRAPVASWLLGMDEKVLLSEIVAALADALGSSWEAPEAARARELIARAGWRWQWISWEDLLERIGDGNYPEPGLERVVDDYQE